MKLMYHRTHAQNAASIVRNGFRLTTGHYGVWLSDTSQFKLSSRRALSDTSRYCVRAKDCLL
jgi:hypothetical protein